MAYQERDVDGRLQSTKLTANDSTAQLDIGTIRRLTDGRTFRYVQMTGGALALGKGAVPAAASAITNLTSASGVGPDGATTTIITDADATWTADAYVGYYFKVDTSMTGSEEAIKIVGNTATTLTLEKSITTALASGGTDDGEIIPPLGVVVISAIDTADQVCAGFGIGTITEDYFGWVQLKGYGNVIPTSALTEGQNFTLGGATTTGQVKVGALVTDGSWVGTVVAAGTSAAFHLAILNVPE